MDGLPHRRFISKSVCCHKDCPKCGGNDCGKQTDSSGKKLGPNECCGEAILKGDRICGEHPAPCKIPVKGEDVWEDFMKEFNEKWRFMKHTKHLRRIRYLIH